MPMPVEEWESYCSFLLLFQCLPEVNVLGFVYNQAFLLQLKRHFYGFL